MEMPSKEKVSIKFDASRYHADGLFYILSHYNIYYAGE